jgi:lipoyl(octanoyl) transferase
LEYSVRYEDVGLKDFKETWEYQEKIFRQLVNSKKHENAGSDHFKDFIPGTLIFVEHPNVYTLGKSGSESNLLLNHIQLMAKDAFFYRTDRGGDITFHGPGQIVGYPIFDLEKLNLSLKEYIHLLEESVIKTISEFGLRGSRLNGATGVWLDPEIKGKARKICAIGVKASRYVTMHGFAFNVNTELNYFNYINPCGFTDKGVTSLEKETGEKKDYNAVKDIVRENLRELFGLKWIN